jgi:Protein of unknown function (DUF2795)
MTEHGNSMPSPALVQHHLRGMHYPATRDDLINYARSQCEGGDHSDSECERVVQTLSQLPDREYQRPTDVSKAFGELARNYLERVSYPAGRDDLVLQPQFVTLRWMGRGAARCSAVHRGAVVCGCL